MMEADPGLPNSLRPLPPETGRFRSSYVGARFSETCDFGCGVAFTLARIEARR
jgi:hypothetical protein